MFWKKVNRGLLLGAALLLFLVGFIVVDEVRFKKEEPVITERCESYLADLFDLQCNLPGEIGTALSESTVEAQKDKMNQLLNTYWYGNLPRDEYSGNGANDLRENYRKYLAENCAVLLNSAEVHLNENWSSVKKDGPNRAKATCSVEITLECKGNENRVFYGYASDANEYGYESEIGWQEEGQSADDKTHTSVISQEMEFELQRVKGEWKIVSFSNRYYR